MVNFKEVKQAARSKSNNTKTTFELCASVYGYAKAEINRGFYVVYPVVIDPTRLDKPKLNLRRKPI